MKRLALFLALFALNLSASACRDRAASSGQGPFDARAKADLEAAQALAKKPEEVRQRIYGSEIVVPGTGVTVRLAEGRGHGPGDPPAWNVELRHVAGLVPSGTGLDVFVDLAIHRALRAPDCYLALFHLEGTATTLASALSVGEGARVVEAKERGAKGETYALEFEYLERAPQGDFLSNPSVRKRRVTEVRQNHFLAAPPPSATPTP